MRRNILKPRYRRSRRAQQHAADKTEAITPMLGIDKLAVGPTWHILGNSGSLLEEEHLADLHPSVGTNCILRLLDSDYLVIMDGDVFQEESHRLKSYAGKIITCPGLEKHFLRRRMKPVVIRLGPHHEMKQSLKGNYALYGNTGMYGIEFAARNLRHENQKGEIWLHGMDFTTKKGKPTHFYGNKKKAKRGGKSNWDSILRYLRKSVAICESYGIVIRNASPWRGPLDKVMGRIHA